MADKKQFGGPKIRQFGDKAPGNQPGDGGHCAQCEAMLADALDGTLSAADQALFDTHMASCGPCAESLADARRGIAFLEMLRYPQPEPPAALLERILAQTSGDSHYAAAVPAQNASYPGATLSHPAESFATPGMAPGYALAGNGNVLPFRTRAIVAIRRSSFGQVMLQPRLAMTAAMAFFSIALTLDLTGVRLQDLRASDLKPSSLKRSFYSANARVVQYYEGLRVVYELESRVHDLQSSTDNDAAVGSQAAPAAQPNSGQPAGTAKPGQNDPDAKPEQKQHPSSSGPASRQMPPSGTSHRDSLHQPLSLVAINRDQRLDSQPRGPMSSPSANTPLAGVERSLV